MHERAHDLTALQQLLDRSDRGAGAHLREIITPDRRIRAEEVCRQLTGGRLLAFATVTADNRPLVGPVDGTFVRGASPFSPSRDSVRVGHIRQRPAVSSAFLPSEELAITF